MGESKNENSELKQKFIALGLAFDKKRKIYKVIYLSIVLVAVISLAAKEGEALYITSVDGDIIEMILNDNDHNYITYSTKYYDTTDIKAKIKQIKQNKS